MSRRLLMVLLLGAFCLGCVSGCVETQSNGQVMTFRYELWVTILSLFSGVAAFLFGWFIRNAAKREAPGFWANTGSYGAGLMFVGVVLGVLVTPTIYLDRVRLDEDRFKINTGLFGMTAVHEIRFEDLKEVRMVNVETVGDGGIRSVKTTMAWANVDGLNDKVEVSTQLKKIAVPHFIQRVKDLGLPVEYEGRPL